MKKLLIKILLLLLSVNIDAVTLVYNLKIRRAVDANAFINKDDGVSWLVTALPIVYARKRHIVDTSIDQNICEKSLNAGAIFNIRGITPDHWWIELTTGLENQTVKNSGTINNHMSRTGLDDIVLTAGKNFIVSDRTQLVGYGLAGFPTRTKISLCEALSPLVGSRFFGLGVGGEASYAFMKSLKRAFIGVLEARFVHFFNRKWFPVFPCDSQIEPGNLTDVFLLLRYREKMDVFEMGYNATFFTQQATLLHGIRVDAPNFLRNSLYLNYLHVFKKSLFLKRPGAIGTGLNIGRAKFLDTKIISGWVNFTLLF